MARIGMNPARGKFSTYRPARVTVAVLVHIPHFSGYFEGRMEVLRACLGSILAHTDEPYDLLVFDNGSCDEVGDYLEGLRRSGSIRYLMRSSQNIGKIGAFQVLFRAAPGEVVAYCDDDIYHYAGWLGAHLAILDTFPGVGMVSGCPVYSLFEEERISSNLRFVDRAPEARLERGQFIPPDWVEEWAESYGRDAETAKKEAAAGEHLVLAYRGLRVYAMANHNQFVSPKSVITRCLPDSWSGRLMGEMRELDIAVNQAGHLRLTTLERTTQHMGNMVSPRLVAHLPESVREGLGTGVGGNVGSQRAGWRLRLLRSRPLRWFLLGVYSRLFHWLNPE